MRKVVRSALVSVVALVIAATSACSKDPEQIAVSEALDRTITALEGGDMKALWDITAPAAQAEVLALHTDLHRGLALVDTVYPEDQRAEVRKALGQAIVGEIPPESEDIGPRVLAKILEPKAVRLDEKARDGLRTRGATIDGNTALIHTSAEEKFTFEKTADGWRSALVIDLIDQNGRFHRLRENARKVLEAHEAQREAWRSSKDPRTPQGGFNLLREELGRKPLNYKKLYSLLDAKTRAVTLEALNKARSIQKHLQRRSKKARRKALYKKYGVDKYSRLETDRGVFKWWVEREDFKPPVPKLAERPEGLEGDPSTGTVVVVTAEGSKHTMRKAEDGIWRLASYEPVIRAALVTPLDTTLQSFAEPEKK